MTEQLLALPIEQSTERRFAGGVTPCLLAPPPEGLGEMPVFATVAVEAEFDERPVDPEIEGLSALQHDWDGQGAVAPNAVAVDASYRVKLELLRARLPAPDVMADAEGGIAFWFYRIRNGRDTGQAALLCMNSGSVLLHLETLPNGRIEVEQALDLSKSLRRVQEFLRSDVC